MVKNALVILMGLALGACAGPAYYAPSRSYQYTPEPCFVDPAYSYGYGANISYQPRNSNSSFSFSFNQGGSNSESYNFRSGPAQYQFSPPNPWRPMGGYGNRCYDTPYGPRISARCMH